MPELSTTAIAALIVAGALFAWFGRLERAGNAPAVVATVFAVVLLDAVIYADQNVVPTGLLHPEFGGESFRLLDVVIPAAILARLLHRPRTGGTPVTLAWLALLAWLATAGLIGVYEGNAPAIVAFQAKAIIYLGALLVAAGVPLGEYVARPRLERFVGVCAGLALALTAVDLAGIAVTADLPLVPLDGFGVMGADAATIFSSLGVLALVLALLQGDRRLPLLACATVLLATPAFADQRAAFIALGVALAVAAVAMLGSRRRVRLTPTEVGLAATAVVGLLLITAVPAVVGQQPVKLPLQDRLTTTFTGYEEVLTTMDRLNQWSAAAPIIAERPIYGHGLGYQYVFWNQGFYKFTQTDLTHNIFGDLMLRAGVVGLLLFLIALGATTVHLARGWAAHASDRAAAFALGIGASVVGLVAKGMAESIFEKYRLAAALGLGIGAMISAGLPATAAARVRAAREPRRSASLPAGARADSP